MAITSLHVAGCPDGGTMSIWRLHGCHCRCDRPRIAARPASPRPHDARRAIVIISKAFLASSWSRKELDGLTTRSGVVASSRTSSRRTWQDIPPGSQSPRPPAPRPSGWFACSVPGRRPGRSNSRPRDGDLVRTPTSLTPGTNRPCAGATGSVRGDGRPCREHAGQRPRVRFGEVYRASRVKPDSEMGLRGVARRATSLISMVALGLPGG